ncbi:MAG: polymer-forming cytoskeletal protein [Verrucomicrobiota bacterium]
MPKEQSRPSPSFFRPKAESEPFPSVQHQPVETKPHHSLPGVAVRDNSTPEPFYGSEDYYPEEDESEGEVKDFAFSEEFEDEIDMHDYGYDMVEVEPLGGASQGKKQIEPLATNSIASRQTECFECNALLEFSAHATSTICRACSAYISLQDHDIREHRREDIQTRGNIIIHRHASLFGNHISCQDLRVFGKISGKIDCSGDTFFRASGKVVGSVRCRHLFVHRLANLTFEPGIRAQTMEIHGKVKGDLICEGTIEISRTGSVIGDCTAPAVKLDDGGILSGQMRIRRPDEWLDQDYARKARAAQEEFLVSGQEEFEQDARTESEEDPEWQEDLLGGQESEAPASEVDSDAPAGDDSLAEGSAEEEQAEAKEG